MKIIVYNSYGQYALSRGELEAIREVLPNECWLGIDKLDIAHSHPKHCEPFEYDVKRKTAYLIVPVLEKTAATRREAIRSVLVGLARIKAGSQFFLPLKARELLDYEDFISRWAPQCEAALVRLHVDA